MAVDSYLELFTTMYGWRFYDIVWDVLSGTGIVYIPFIMILVKNWVEPAKNAGYRAVWTQSLKGMEIEFYLAVFVAMLAGSPTLPLQANILSYTPPATLVDPAPTTATVASPDSTYGSNGAFSTVPGAATVPVWWYAILAISKGVNHAIISGMPATAGIRQVEHQAELATIANPQLRREAQQFYNDCYLPARSTYLREQPSSPAIDNLLDTWGGDDTEWVGSHVYTSLYYADMRSTRRVPGWPYDPARDVDYDPSGSYVWGQPTCQEWWTDPNQGLRARISSEAASHSSVENTLTGLIAGLPGFLGAAPVVGGAVDHAKDWAVRRALNNARVDANVGHMPDDFNRDSQGVIDTVFNAGAQVLGAAGAVATYGTMTVMSNVVKLSLPLLQALLLLGIYALLPFVVVFSRYSLSMMVVGAIGIFTVNFWSVLWHIGKWVDENLMASMAAMDVGGWLRAMSTGGVNALTRDAVFSTMLMLFLIGLPLLWSAMMAWISINSARVINDSLSGATAPAQKAGNAGASAGGKILGGGRKAPSGGKK